MIRRALSRPWTFLAVSRLLFAISNAPRALLMDP